MPDLTYELKEAATELEYLDFIDLVSEYLRSLPFEIDFQDLDAELASPSLEYSRVNGGVAIIGYVHSKAIGSLAVRRLEDGVAELKRMYVVPDFRGVGIAREMLDMALDVARELGYRSIKLDTVAEMVPAITLYRSVGFEQTSQYRINPLASARFFELVL